MRLIAVAILVLAGAVVFHGCLGRYEIAVYRGGPTAPAVVRLDRLLGGACVLGGAGWPSLARTATDTENVERAYGFPLCGSLLSLPRKPDEPK